MDMRNLVGDNTVLLSVMNGIESEEQLGAVFGMNKVLYAVAVGIDAMREGNVVTYSRKEERFISVKPDNSGLTERVKALQSLFTRAGIVSETPRRT
jgi:2-dehydropantoate 2-reductase